MLSRLSVVSRSVHPGECVAEFEREGSRVEQKHRRACRLGAEQDVPQAVLLHRTHHHCSGRLPRTLIPRYSRSWRPFTRYFLLHVTFFRRVRYYHR